MERKNQIGFVRNVANGALLVGFIAVIYERINPGTQIPYILIAVAGLISFIGFIYMIARIKPIKINEMGRGE
jgi:hypothetical protein